MTNDKTTQPEAQPQWQPIETAPKDSTNVLIYTPNSRKQVQEAWWAIQYEGSIDGYWSTPIGPAGRGYTILPEAATHWMPLPAAPSAQAVPQQADTVTLVGVKADGTEHVLGTATMPPKMRAKELVREMFGSIDEETGDDGAMALWVCEQLIEWMQETSLVVTLTNQAEQGGKQ